MFAGRYYPTRYYPQRYFPKVGDTAAFQSFSISIANSVFIYGPAAASQWGTMIWGESQWGEGSDMVTTVFKYLQSDVESTFGVAKFQHRLYQETVTTEFEMSSEELSDGRFNYVFTRPTINNDQSVNTQWTEGSNQSTSYTSLSASSITWSSLS